MENSAKAQTFPSWAKLKRDKGNYPTWRKHAFDLLQANGCEQAISSEYSQLEYDSVSDSDSSDEDFEDDFPSFTQGGGRRKHETPSLRLHLQHHRSNLRKNTNRKSVRFCKAQRKQGRKSTKKGKEERRRRSLKKRRGRWMQELGP